MNGAFVSFVDQDAAIAFANPAVAHALRARGHGDRIDAEQPAVKAVRTVRVFGQHHMRSQEWELGTWTLPRRHGRARPSLSASKNVDGRDKPGHDDQL
ncbi:hypothetical protein IVA88_12065 [Bradyrhizobium sp. 149]|nr:hypothetical protein [Bradyrhizobium sp. 149]